MSNLTSYKSPIFDGDENNYEMWQIKFLTFMRLKGKHDIFREESGDIDEEKNAQAFAERIQCIDDKSLSLIIRDAKDDGRKAMKIPYNHYQPKGKPRIITLYTELTSLTLSPKETVTNFIVRAETIATHLRNAKETISDSLLTAMVMKALPSRFKSFTAVINQKEDDLTFSDFKQLLRIFEDQEKIHNDKPASSSSIMTSSFLGATAKPKRWCRNCKMNNHDTEYCRRNPSKPTLPNDKFRNKKWCDHCKTGSHETKHCRRISKMKMVETDDSTNNEGSNDNHFLFNLDNLFHAKNQPNEDRFLVDSGATVLVLNDSSKFSKFNKNFDSTNHIIKLAYGTRCANVATGQGDSHIFLTDNTGVGRSVTLKNALSSNKAEKWKQAMNDEMQALGENDTFELTPLPPDRKPVGGNGFTP